MRVPNLLLILLINFASLPAIAFTKDLATNKILLADVNFNRFTRSHDGLTGLWTYHGVANQSLASKREFAFNADLVDPSEFRLENSYHYDLATMTRPLAGMTSDADEDYLVYLILQSKVAGVDGFLVEWGYEGHQSDVILKKLFLIVSQKGLKFTLAVNWCEHWLKQHLGNATSAEFESAFYANALYLNDLLSKQPMALRYQERPVVFLFGGGINSQQFQDYLAKSSASNSTNGVLWLGNYLNMGSTSQFREEWQDLLNGTFAWMSHDRTPSPGSWLDRWDKYTLPQDTADYQRTVSQWAKPLLASGKWQTWSASVNPGEDNRSCAGWGQTLKYVPRQWGSTNSYSSSWKNQLSSSADILILITLTDYSESTVVLPTEKNGFDDLLTTCIYKKLWIGRPTTKDDCQIRNIELPFYWYQLTKTVSRYAQVTGTSFERTKRFLKKMEDGLIREDYNTSLFYLSQARKCFRADYSQIQTRNITIVVPSVDLFPVGSYVTSGDAYVINATQKLSLRMSDQMADQLKTNYYRGLLELSHMTVSPFHSELRVLGSSSRTSSVQYGFPQHGYKAQSSNFGLISEIHTPSYKTGIWLSAAVETLAENLDWGHGLPGTCDLVFSAADENSLMLLRQMRITFYIYSKGLE